MKYNSEISNYNYIANKKYVNKNILNQVSKKWFEVYEYITVSELLLTIKQDYIKAISNIHLVFFISTLIVWALVFASESSFAIIIWYLLFIYFLIFIYVLFKLFRNTLRFFKISHVVYTDSWILIWKDFYNYDSDKKLIIDLFKYSEYFKEYLSEPSSLKEAIKTWEWLLFKKVLKSSSKTLELSNSISWFGSKSSRGFNDFNFNFNNNSSNKNKWDFRLVLVAWLLIWIYVISMYLSYYLGLILWFTLLILKKLLLSVYESKFTLN